MDIETKLWIMQLRDEMAEAESGPTDDEQLVYAGYVRQQLDAILAVGN